MMAYWGPNVTKNRKQKTQVHWGTPENWPRPFILLVLCAGSIFVSRLQTVIEVFGFPILQNVRNG